MFGLQEIIALNNGSIRIAPVATLELSTNAHALRAAILARDSKHGSQPDLYVEETGRQNTGTWCRKCGSRSGHYDFCETINGGHRG